MGAWKHYKPQNATDTVGDLLDQIMVQHDLCHTQLEKVKTQCQRCRDEEAGSSHIEESGHADRDDAYAALVTALSSIRDAYTQLVQTVSNDELSHGGGGGDEDIGII